MNIAPTKYADPAKTHQFCAKKRVLTIFRSTSKHVPNYPKRSHSHTNAVSTDPISKNFPTALPKCQMGNQQQDQQDQQQYPYQKQQQETADHINFYPETEEKTPLANITAVYTIANKQNDYATGKTLKQFTTEAKRMKDALARKPTQNPTSPPKNGLVPRENKLPPKPILTFAESKSAFT